MRVLSLLATIALVSSSEAAILEKTSVAKTTDSDIAFLPRALTVEHQTKRSLRRYGEGDLAPAGEERAGTSENFYGLAENFAHLGFSEVSNARAVAQASKLAARAERAERVERMKAVAQKYPHGLSKQTLKQLVEVERRRETDIDQINKGIAGGMFRQMEHVDGMKYAPRLESNTGRANQRYDEDGSRMLSCIVASRSPEEGGGDVLLISSSNPKKQDWLLPKGGWDNDETIEYAAWRELMEEGGVEGSIVSPLQPFKFWKGDDGYVYHPFMMHATTVFDQWAESMRYRIWVSYDDAEKLLWKRPEMIDVVNAARSAD